MRRSVVATIIIALLTSCGGQGAEEVSSQGISVDEAIVDTIAEVPEELEYIIEIPPASYDDACLPYPSVEFCERIKSNDTYDYSLRGSYLYCYVVAHFDSLSERVHEPMEDEYDMGVYNWSQEFSGGISYTEFFGGEGGATGILYTSCSNLEAVYSTINALVNYRVVNSEWEYDGVWNDAKTEYGPEGAGCYYDIILNDSTEFYQILNYCGC